MGSTRAQRGVLATAAIFAALSTAITAGPASASTTRASDPAPNDAPIAAPAPPNKSPSDDIQGMVSLKQREGSADVQEPQKPRDPGEAQEPTPPGESKAQPASPGGTAAAARAVYCDSVRYDWNSWRANCRVTSGQARSWTYCSDGSIRFGTWVGRGYWIFGGDCGGYRLLDFGYQSRG